MHRIGPITSLVLAAITPALIAGCDAPPIKPVLTDPDPSIKIPAIELAVQRNDRSAIPVLIKSLESDDPAIRFYANNALRKLTGQDFGFLYYADDELRRPAVKRWQAWLASGATSAGTSSNGAVPSSNPATEP
jgi:hypothetical protein